MSEITSTSKRVQSNGGPSREGITAITVGGFKSIATAQSIEVRPLTILAGANSSGKSSFMQPLLLLKQTLDAPYDPGPLLLDGPNVKFTSGEQFLSRPGPAAGPLRVGVRLGTGPAVTLDFSWSGHSGFAIEQMALVERGSAASTILRPGMSQEEIEGSSLSIVRTAVNLARVLKRNPKLGRDGISVSPTGKALKLEVMRDRCFLGVTYRSAVERSGIRGGGSQAGPVAREIQRVIHVPGLRGNPERNYPVTAVEKLFPGRFENYVASVIFQWEATGNSSRIAILNAQLERLELTWKVKAHRITETQVELRVGRLTRGRRGGAHDLVSIADVGFGVSQVLPALIALLVAEKGQTVCVEQPELHLHPRAQAKLAGVLADAAKRGVRVIAETHSSLLIRGIQILVAEGKLDPSLVRLLWFTRNTHDGRTTVSSADLDENGAFGDWPIDFDEVELRSEGAYLDAVGLRSR